LLRTLLMRQLLNVGLDKRFAPIFAADLRRGNKRATGQYFAVLIECTACGKCNSALCHRPPNAIHSDTGCCPFQFAVYAAYIWSRLRYGSFVGLYSWVSGCQVGMTGAGARVIAKMVVVFDAQHVCERDRRRATMALYEASLCRAVIHARSNQLAQSWVSTGYDQLVLLSPTWLRSPTNCARSIPAIKRTATDWQ